VAEKRSPFEFDEVRKGPWENDILGIPGPCLRLGKGDTQHGNNYWNHLSDLPRGVALLVSNESKQMNTAVMTLISSIFVHLVEVVRLGLRKGDRVFRVTANHFN
jgi:hypothetical protein